MVCEGTEVNSDNETSDICPFLATEINLLSYLNEFQLYPNHPELSSLSLFSPGGDVGVE